MDDPALFWKDCLAVLSAIERQLMENPALRHTAGAAFTLGAVHAALRDVRTRFEGELEATRVRTTPPKEPTP